MKTSQYRHIAKAIAAHTKGEIWERWRYGRLLLVDSQATTPAGHLRDGVLGKLIAASAIDGVTLNESDIQRCLRAGRAYPTETQFRHSSDGIGSWTAFWQAGFPAPPDGPDSDTAGAAEDVVRPGTMDDGTPAETGGALAYDPRSTDDLVRQHDGRGARLLPDSDQLSLDLFPKHDFDATLAELDRYAQEQAEITARFTARDERRRRYLEELIEAVDGDLTKTLREARAALTEEDAL